MERFINPYNDYGFKKLFGTKENKDLLISFLNALLEGKENTITDVNYTDLEELDSIAGRRVSYFDIECHTSEGACFIVELQNNKTDCFADKTENYFNLKDCHQLPKELTWDKQINNVYLFCIVSTNPYTKRHKQNTCYNESQLTDVVNDHILYKKLTFVYLDLSKLEATKIALNTLLDKWIYALYCLAYTDESPKELMEEEIFKKLFEAAWLANLNDAQELAYDQAQMAMWDEYAVLESAWREGYVQGLMLLVAKALIKKDFDLTTIMKITGLSEDEIQKLTNSLPN
ncbi:MAG: Rpn family recombination-promoting nuclease/putative transposase [Bacteroidales bacterium]|nr:Rpn family recombination-promoting nuclease/putative transposase [Bacteroidales bacterium]